MRKLSALQEMAILDTLRDEFEEALKNFRQAVK